MLRPGTLRIFANLPRGTFDVFHGIAMVEHVVVSYASGAVGELLNHVAVGEPSDMIAEVRALSGTPVSLTFREKCIAATASVFWASEALADVRGMLTA